MGFVWPRWVIQPVPVYSQYMSISPDSSAFRAATDPARPIWSFTVAPAFSRTCSVIWPRISCSVNSLEPTVNSAPERSTSPDAPPPPPPPQPAIIRVRTARSPSSCVSFARIVRTAILLQGLVWSRASRWSRLQTLGAQNVFGHASQPVDEQGHNGRHPACGDQHARPVQPDSVVDRLPQSAGAYERSQRGGAYVDNQGCPDAGQDDWDGEGQLDAEEHSHFRHSHAAGGLDGGPIHLPQAHHGVPQNRQKRVRHQRDDARPESNTPDDRQKSQHTDGGYRLAYVGQPDYERRHTASEGSGEQDAGDHGQRNNDSGGDGGEFDESGRLLDEGARVQGALLDAVEILRTYVQVERQDCEPEEDGHSEVA